MHKIKKIFFLCLIKTCLINCAQKSDLSSIKDALPLMFLYGMKQAASVYEAFEIYTTGIIINKNIAQQFQEQWHKHWPEIMDAISSTNRNTHHYFTKKFAKTFINIATLHTNMKNWGIQEIIKKYSGQERMYYTNPEITTNNIVTPWYNFTCPTLEHSPISLLEAFYFYAPTNQEDNSINLITKGSPYDIWSWKEQFVKRNKSIADDYYYEMRQSKYTEEYYFQTTYPTIIVGNFHLAPCLLSYKIAQSNKINQNIAACLLKKGTLAEEILIKRFPNLNHLISDKKKEIPSLPQGFYINTLLCLLDEIPHNQIKKYIIEDNFDYLYEHEEKVVNNIKNKTEILEHYNIIKAQKKDQKRLPKLEEKKSEEALEKQRKEKKNIKLWLKNIAIASFVIINILWIIKILIRILTSKNYNFFKKNCLL